MVKPSAVVTVGRNCDVCGVRFVNGDRAIVVIKVPDVEMDTICVPDWQAIIRCAGAWLKEKGEVPSEAPETLPAAPQTLLTYVVDPSVN